MVPRAQLPPHPAVVPGSTGEPGTTTSRTRPQCATPRGTDACRPEGQTGSRAAGAGAPSGDISGTH